MHRGSRGASARGLRTIVYGGGPMYVGDLERALARLGDAPRADLRPGREPDDHHRLSQGAPCRPRASALRERLASVGVPHSVVEVRVRDEEGRALPRRRGRRDLRARRRRDVGLLEQSRGHGARAARRLAVDRRRRRLRRGRLPHAEGPLQGPDHQRRLEHLSARDRGGAAARIPAVAEASVVGRPIREWGEEVVAFVVRARRARRRADELDRLCLDNIARFKRPKDYRFVDALPKNNYGKVLKTELRAMLAAGRAGARLRIGRMDFFPGFRRERVRRGRRRRASTPSSARAREAPAAAAAARLSADARDLAQGRAAAGGALHRRRHRPARLRRFGQARDRPPTTRRTRSARWRGPGRGDARARLRALPRSCGHDRGGRVAHRLARRPSRRASTRSRCSTSRRRSRCTSRPPRPSRAPTGTGSS